MKVFKDSFSEYENELKSNKKLIDSLEGKEEIFENFLRRSEKENSKFYGYEITKYGVAGFATKWNDRNRLEIS